MRISELIKNKRTFSFEVFPPKEDKPLDPLHETLNHLYDFEPDFISCTYGAGGTNKGRSIEVCKLILDSNHDVMTHFTCIGNDKTQVEELLSEYIELGIKNVLLLRGDLPDGWESTKGDFTHADELISFVRDKHPDLSIGAAAYPEKHVESDNLDKDIEYLKLKQEKGADFFVAQLCHDVNAYERFIERIRKAGITIPVIAGVMPILFRNGTINMTLSNGCSVPPELSQIMGKYEHDVESFREAGKEFTVRQIERFLNADIDGMHIYALNRHKDITDILNWAGIVSGQEL